MLEIFNAQPAQFSIAASGIQGGLHQQSEIGRAQPSPNPKILDFRTLPENPNRSLFLGSGQESLRQG